MTTTTVQALATELGVEADVVIEAASIMAEALDPDRVVTDADGFGHWLAVDADEADLLAAELAPEHAQAVRDEVAR